MNLLFLRGSVPQDRNPQEIVFEKIQDVDDVWTQLAFNMTSSKDNTELWYWGGNREKKFSSNFTERWVKSFDEYKSSFVPDVIFCRGGFPEYHTVLRKYNNAFKIYYGAGRRFLPQEGFIEYDLILQDSIEQLEICMKKFPNIPCSLFIKPAAENIFYKNTQIKKEFDIVFPANGKQELVKGHKFVFSTAPSKYRILNLGNNGSFEPPTNITRYRVLRSDMRDNIQKAKIGIVCCEPHFDSCPRVIPEMLACDIPIVCLSDIRFWKEKYIAEKTGRIANKNNFWDIVDDVLNNLHTFAPREYYDEQLNLNKAASLIRSLIKI